MSKLNNYIYYSICEKSYELFKESNFMSYRMFCFSFKNSILLNDFGSKEFRIIDELYTYLRLIYDLDYNIAYEYIGEYFPKSFPKSCLDISPDSILPVSKVFLELFFKTLSEVTEVLLE